MPQLTQFMPPPETFKSEIGSQSTTLQVHTGAYVSANAWRNRPYRLQRKKDYDVYSTLSSTSLHIRATDARQL